MLNYHLRCLRRELWYSLTHPHRKDWFELRYAIARVWDDVLYPFKQPIWFLQTVWAYRDVLWNDRDWDSAYLLVMMERKLRRMADHIGTYGHHVGSERDAKQLRVAAELCRRVRLDQYNDAALNRLKQREGLNWNDAAQSKKRMRIYKMSEARRKADIRMIGRLFDKHLLSWWD